MVTKGEMEGINREIGVHNLYNRLYIIEPII